MKHKHQLTITFNNKEIDMLYDFTSLLEVHCCELMSKEEKYFLKELVDIIEERR